VLITISAVADPTATCNNPGDQSKVPGQNPAPVVVTRSVSIPASEIKNGTTPFAVSTEAPVTPIAGAPDCPNTGWTEAITDMAFTSATITVEQPPGTVVLTVSCSFSPATSDGDVSRADVNLHNYLDPLVAANSYGGQTFGVSAFASLAGLWYRRARAGGGRRGAAGDVVGAAFRCPSAEAGRNAASDR
jgi:hypothetical protein